MLFGQEFCVFVLYLLNTSNTCNQQIHLGLESFSEEREEMVCQQIYIILNDIISQMLLPPFIK